MGLSAAVVQKLPRYRSHKVVQAAKINAITSNDDGTKLIVLSLNQGGEHVQQVFTEEDLRNRPEPERGGYLVVYENGYHSFSPEKVFRDGYDLI